jgi:hypothetical protein
MAWNPGNGEGQYTLSLAEFAGEYFGNDLDGSEYGIHRLFHDEGRKSIEQLQFRRGCASLYGEHHLSRRIKVLYPYIPSCVVVSSV